MVSGGVRMEIGLVLIVGNVCVWCRRVFWFDERRVSQKRKLASHESRNVEGNRVRHLVVEGASLGGGCKQANFKKQHHQRCHQQGANKAPRTLLLANI